MCILQRITFLAKDHLRDERSKSETTLECHFWCLKWLPWTGRNGKTECTRNLKWFGIRQLNESKVEITSNEIAIIEVWSKFLDWINYSLANCSSNAIRWDTKCLFVNDLKDLQNIQKNFLSYRCRNTKWNSFCLWVLSLFEILVRDREWITHDTHFFWLPIKGQSIMTQWKSLLSWLSLLMTVGASVTFEMKT